MIHTPIEKANKPLFIPLKGEFYDAFHNGSKDTEYRLYGARWNERTCTLGRLVVLSRGYGKRHRMTGKVVDFWTSRDTAKSPAFQACYPKAVKALAACIRIQVERQ